MKSYLLLTIVVVLFSSCRYIDSDRIHGEGPMVTEERSVDEFESVSAHGAYNIFLTAAPTRSVRVEAEENLQPYIETYVEGRELKVRAKRGYDLSPGYDIKVYVSAPAFEYLSVHGSGNILGENTITGEQPLHLSIAGSGNIDLKVDVAETDASIAGSGNIKLSGSSQKFSSSIHGSGDIRAMELQSEEASVEIAGSGNADVYANQKLSVNVAGSGDIRHRGAAQVSSHIAGSGSVVKVD